MVDLSQNDIAYVGIIRLIDGLKLNKQVHTIHIESNKFKSVEIAKPFEEMLKKNTILLELNGFYYHRKEIDKLLFHNKTQKDKPMYEKITESVSKAANDVSKSVITALSITPIHPVPIKPKKLESHKPELRFFKLPTFKQEQSKAPQPYVSLT
jgi:hypothetical protein